MLLQTLPHNFYWLIQAQASKPPVVILQLCSDFENLMCESYLTALPPRWISFKATLPLRLLDVKEFCGGDVVFWSPLSVDVDGFSVNLFCYYSMWHHF